MRRQLALAMKHEAGSAAEKIAGLLDCSPGDLMLDVGGGTGSYSIAFAQHYPGLKVVVLDHDDEALKLARADIQACKLEERITVKKGDVLLDDFGSDYTLVFLASILCTCGDAEVRLLLKKAWRSLSGGGRLVIRDFLLDESGTSPTLAALFSVNMLVNTQHGRVYSRSEVRGWLEEAGFERVHCIPMGSMQLVIGSKVRG